MATPHTGQEGPTESKPPSIGRFVRAEVPPPVWEKGFSFPHHRESRKPALLLSLPCLQHLGVVGHLWKWTQAAHGTSSAHAPDSASERFQPPSYQAPNKVTRFEKRAKQGLRWVGERSPPLDQDPISRPPPPAGGSRHLGPPPPQGQTSARHFAPKTIEVFNKTLLKTSQERILSRYFWDRPKSFTLAMRRFRWLGGCLLTGGGAPHPTSLVKPGPQCSAASGGGGLYIFLPQAPD